MLRRVARPDHPNRRIATLVLVASLAVTAGAAGQGHLQRSEPRVAVTESQSGSGGHIEAVVDIDAARDRVWRTMLDCAISKRIIAGLQLCRVIERDPDGRWDVREHRVAWSVLLPTVRSVFRSDYILHSQISFQRTDGDLKRLQGVWKLLALNNGRTTRLTYTADVDPGVPLPGAIVRPMIETDVLNLLKALRREAEGGHAG